MSVMNDGKRVFIEKKDFLTNEVSKHRLRSNDEVDLNIQMPRGSQAGHGIDKVISRNPVNLGTVFNTEDVIIKKPKKKDIFIYNEDGKQSMAQPSKNRSPSTRHFTLSNDNSISNIHQLTEPDNTQDYNTIDNSASV